jgi:GNAT superfamily N-acetyltransferase
VTCRIETATLQDIDYLCHLQRIEANRDDAIGFLPKVAYENEIRGIRHGTILVARENDDEVGFLYATHNRHGVTHIQQVAVQDDARRLDIGGQLVGAVTRTNDWLVSLRCREGLPSVDFWTALGFEVNNIDHTPTKRKRPVLHLQKIVGGLWK